MSDANSIISIGVGLATFAATGSPQAGQWAYLGTSVALGVINPAQVDGGPRLQDLKASALEYGTPIPPCYGSPRVPGIWAWASDKQTVESTEGGKGGPEVTSYSYKQDVLIILADGEIADVRRVWSNGKLIWSQADDATDATVAASADTPAWDAIEVFNGAAEQLPWTVYEAAVGVGNAPAMRGRAYVGITGLNLGNSGYAPQLTFEIVTQATADFSATQLWEFQTPAEQDPNNVFVGSLDPDNVFTVPIGIPTTFRYFPYGLYQDGTFATYAEALALAESQVGDNATDNFDNVTDIAYTLTSVDLSESVGNFVVETRTYHVTFNTNIGPGETDYFFQLKYGSGDYSLTTADGVSRDVTAVEFPLDLHLSGDSDNEGQYAFGTSDAAMVLSHAGTLDPVNRYAINGVGVYPVTTSFGYGGNGPRYQYAKVGAKIFIYEKEPSYVRAFDYADGTQTGVSAELTLLSSSQIWCMCADASTIYLAMPFGGTTGGIRRMSTATLEFNDSDVGIPYPSGATGSGTKWWIFLNADDELCAYFGQKVYLYDTGTATWSVDLDLTGTAYDGDHFIHNPIYRRGGLFVVQDMVASEGARWQGLGVLERTTREPVPLSEVVLDLCLRAGLDEAYVDVTELATTYVRALAVSQVTSARAVIEQLMAAYLFTATEGDTLRFVMRGGASAATLAFDDLGAGEGSAAAEPLPITRRSDIEIPAQVAITYSNFDADYQQATEYSDRLIGTATGVATAQLALAFTAQEAKRIADTRLLDGALAATSIGPVGITQEWAELEPTDVVTVVDETGSTFRARIERITDAAGVRSLELAIDDASVLSSAALSSSEYTGSTVVRALSDTLLDLLDIPILRDADDNAGHYVAVGPDSAAGTWPGAAVFRGIANAGYIEQVRVTDRTVIGTTSGVLPDWAGGVVFDETSTVTVEVSGTLSSYTRDAILQGTADAYLIGDEVIYAKTAALVSAGVYTLSGLLRGRRGTEWATGSHETGERVVRLQLGGLRRIVSTNAELGTEYSFKAPTFGRSLASATEELFTNTAVGLKPFAPVDLRVTGGPSSWVVTWLRRTRLSCRFTGALGINVPLGEAAESYVVEVYDGSDALVSTATVTAPTATVTASAGYTVRVYQVSATVGRGYPSSIEL